MQTPVRRDLFSFANLAEVKRRHKLDDAAWCVALTNAFDDLQQPLETLQKHTAVLLRQHNARTAAGGTAQD